MSNLNLSDTVAPKVLLKNKYLPPLLNISSFLFIIITIFVEYLFNKILFYKMLNLKS